MLFAHTIVEVVDNPIKTKHTISYGNYAEYTIQGKPYRGISTTAEMSIAYAPGNNSLKKPFVIVEGFDPRAFKDSPKGVWNFENNVIKDRNIFELRKKGYSVGVMDADITGPSIPRLMNVSEQKMATDGKNMYPVVTEDGIEIVSINLMIDENEPVVWRGPVIAGAVMQFWNEVVWSDLDYLLIDMPPGTGDVPLTVMKSFNIKGLIMVSIPQDMVSMIVTKAIKMARKMMSM